MDRFTLVERIGRGAMGEVWRALERDTGRVVALKFLHASLADDETYRERFAREVDLARRVDSPYVVKVLGYGVREERPYVALEHVGGQTLRDSIAERGARPWAEVRGLVTEIATGLAAIHRAGILHRDLKPANVLLSEDGVPKIADFGIAKAGDLNTLTATAAILGTPNYMAPEGPKDARSDLYGLGVIAYELLAGVVPFSGTTPQEVLLAHLRTEPDLERIPREARGVVGSLLAKDPNLRPQSTDALLATLEPPKPRRTSPPSERGRSRGRRSGRPGIEVLANVRAIAGGGEHFAALLADGTVRSWGANGFGQLGDGTTLTSAAPVAVVGLSHATAIAPGGAHACVLLADGTVRCWGAGMYGQIGDGSDADALAPVIVTGLRGVVALAGGGDHTCALLADGTVRCWGDSEHGQLGDGSSSSSSPVPVEVGKLTRVMAIAAGGDHTCALLADGTVRCWGWNERGQVGDGTFEDAVRPARVARLSAVVSLAAGGDHTCAVLADGTVGTWGSNLRGQLGDGTTIDSAIPVAVEGLTDAVAVAAGDDHTCAILADGTVRCWGANDEGQLGDGTTVDAPTPVEVDGLTGAVGLAISGSTTCVLLSDGTVRCWGAGSG